MMQLECLAIADIVKIVPSRHDDDRGYFSEVFKDVWFDGNLTRPE
jgi:dTDP-4-dehydrorhamnose 3,5-epimerase